MSKLNFNDILNLNIGDTLYEYSYGIEICSAVISNPSIDINNPDYVKVKVKDRKTGEEFFYGVNKKYQHYAPNVYNYKAYISEEELRGELQKG